MCYGTLPRGGICPSVVFLIEMSVLEKQSLATLLILMLCHYQALSSIFCFSDAKVRISEKNTKFFSHVFTHAFTFPPRFHPTVFLLPK